MDKVKLTRAEEQELNEGQALYELTKTEGFKVIENWLNDMAYHSWVDPREIEGPDAEKEWKWRELNAFHAANNARELLERIQKSVSRSEYLDKKKKGEIDLGRMGIGRTPPDASKK
jgi:hypothetical protein